MKQPSGPIFIGGAGRSGTTLLRVMLDAHPNICCGPELKVLPLFSEWHAVLTSGAWSPVMGYYQQTPADVSGHFRRLIESLVEKFRRSSGKPRWAEKTPENVLHMITLGMIFPDAQFLHVIRDGRDVACSLVTMNWINPATGQKSWHTQSIANAARYWRQTVETARRQAGHPSLAGRVLEVRYEQLVAQTEETLRKVLAFVGEPWHEGVLNYHEKAQDRDGEPVESSTSDTCKPVYRRATGRWRREMSVSDRVAFAREAGDLLEQLGYVRDPSWSRPPLDPWATNTVQVAGPMTLS